MDPLNSTSNLTHVEPISDSMVIPKSPGLCNAQKNFNKIPVKSYIPIPKIISSTTIEAPQISMILQTEPSQLEAENTNTSTNIEVMVIGDPHFKINNIKDTEPMTEAILKAVTTANPDFIVVLGDTLDRHESIHVSPLARAIDFLHRLTLLKPVYLLIGNHDLKNNRQFLSDEHPFTSLKYWGPRMTVIDTTQILNIKGHTFTFVPYVPNGRFIEALNYSTGWQASTCIFAHQEFRGCRMGSITSVDGDDWPPYYPLVVSGHIHDYQQPQENIIYTGTPIQHSFGDQQNKTISHFIFDSPTQYIQNRIKLGLRKKKISRITCTDITNHVPKENCDLKIIISGTQGEISAARKHINISKWESSGIKIFYVNTSVVTSDDIEDKISAAPKKYSQALYESIRSDQRLVHYYEKVFGNSNDHTSYLPITSQ